MSDDLIPVDDPYVTSYRRWLYHFRQRHKEETIDREQTRRAYEANMTDEDERRAQCRLHFQNYIASEAGEAAAEAGGVMLEALEKERKAKSDDARADAQAAFLAGRAAFDRAFKSTDLLRRRMVVEARDIPSGALVKAADFEPILMECLATIEERASRNRLRRLLARYFIDNEETLTPSVRLLVDKLFKNLKGLMGGIDLVEKKSGLDQTKGPDDDIRTTVVIAAGYTAGVELGLNGNIPFSFWKRAQRRHSYEADGLRKTGLRIAPVKAATVRDWCERAAGSYSEEFRKSRAEGFAKRDNPTPSRGVDHRPKKFFHQL